MGEQRMERFRGYSWKVAADAAGNPLSTEGAILAVLQDIREELQKLNSAKRPDINIKVEVPRRIR